MRTAGSHRKQASARCKSVKAATGLSCRAPCWKLRRARSSCNQVTWLSSGPMWKPSKMSLCTSWWSRKALSTRWSAQTGFSPEAQTAAVGLPANCSEAFYWSKMRRSLSCSCKNCSDPLGCSWRKSWGPLQFAGRTFRAITTRCGRGRWSGFRSGSEPEYDAHSGQAYACGWSCCHFDRSLIDLHPTVDRIPRLSAGCSRNSSFLWSRCASFLRGIEWLMLKSTWMQNIGDLQGKCKKLQMASSFRMSIYVTSRLRYPNKSVTHDGKTDYFEKRTHKFKLV